MEKILLLFLITMFSCSKSSNIKIKNFISAEKKYNLIQQDSTYIDVFEFISIYNAMYSKLSDVEKIHCDKITKDLTYENLRDYKIQYLNLNAIIHQIADVKKRKYIDSLKTLYMNEIKQYSINTIKKHHPKSYINIKWSNTKITNNYIEIKYTIKATKQKINSVYIQYYIIFNTTIESEQLQQNIEKYKKTGIITDKLKKYSLNLGNDSFINFNLAYNIQYYKNTKSFISSNIHKKLKQNYYQVLFDVKSVTSMDGEYISSVKFNKYLYYSTLYFDDHIKTLYNIDIYAAEHIILNNVQNFYLNTEALKAIHKLILYLLTLQYNDKFIVDEEFKKIININKLGILYFK